MSILSSLYTGISGIEANGTALGVVADNIANANTVGFKTSRPEFEDIIARSLEGTLTGNQIGRGAQLGSIKSIFSQGNLIQTERPTDLAISGDGFFILQGQDGFSFSRNGSFNFNQDGQLINTNGNKVLGFKAGDDGRVTTRMAPIKIDKNVLAAKQTTEVNMAINLDIRDDIIKKGFDVLDPDKTSNYSTSVNVYDSAGNNHTLTLYFTKAADNEWKWNAVAKGSEIQGGPKGKGVIGASGSLIFDTNGKFLKQSLDSSSFSFTKGASLEQKIEFYFGREEKLGKDFPESTQYGTASDIYEHNQNGYSAGTIRGLSFSDDGILAAHYSNGISLNISQIALGKFQNNEGLLKLGNNAFRESLESGSANVGAPNSGDRGRIFSKTIESSTTDIASEFVSLIKLQRAFQANARTMTTSDELMQEILNIRRG